MGRVEPGKRLWEGAVSGKGWWEGLGIVGMEEAGRGDCGQGLNQGPSPRLTYTLWGALTALHLYANYRAVRAVVMETLNRPRLRLALHHFLRHGHAPSPAYANACEPLLPGGPGWDPGVQWGVGIRDPDVRGGGT